MKMQLSCTARFVGPRNSLSEDEHVYFALQVAVGFDEEPVDNTQRSAAATISLPWNAMADGTQLRAYLAQPEEVPELLTIVTIPPETLDDFGAKLRAHIERRAGKLANADPKPQFSWVANGEITESTDTLHVWPALMQTLANLPPPLSSICRATWYAKCATEKLDEETVKNSVLFLVPESIRRVGPDLGGELVFTLKDPEAPAGALNEPYEFKYEAGDGTVASAFTPGIVLSSLTKDVEAFGLDSYWLGAVDSRGKTLVSVEQQIDKGMDALLQIKAIDALAVEPLIEVSGGTEPLLIDRRRALATALYAFATDFAGSDAPPAQNALKAEHAKWEKRRRERIDEVLLKFKDESGPTQRDRLRQVLQNDSSTWWKVVLDDATLKKQLIDSKLLLAGETLALREAGTLSLPLLDHVLPFESEIVLRPVLPKEGIDFHVGSEAKRLVHENENDAYQQGQLAEVGAIGVLVRRAKDEASLPDAPWRLVTTGVPVIDELGDVLTKRPWGAEPNEPDLPHGTFVVPRGLGAAFVDGILRNDHLYAGVPLGAASALSFVHGRSEFETDPETDAGFEKQRLAYLSFESVAPVKDQIGAAIAKHCAAPPLRYGDWYEISGFVIDRAGGLPDEMTADEPWKVDFTTLADLEPVRPPARAHFLRRVPVGEINILPGIGGLVIGADREERMAEWPALPKGVTLRSREWLDAKTKSSDNGPSLLLGEKMPGAIDGYEFSIEPPRLDEHTLQRWLMPAIGGGDTVGELEALKRELTRIFARRKEAVDEDENRADDDPRETVDAIKLGQKLLPHDPAVVAVFAKITRVNEAGINTEEMKPLSLEVSAVSPFMWKPFAIYCRRSGADAKAGALNVPLEEGHFACIELYPAVKEETFKSRLDGQALEGLYDPQPLVHEKVSYILFNPTRVLVEHATRRMPTEKALYDAFTLRLDDTGAVIAALNAGVAIPNLQFIDRFEISRQRWAWRNVPLTNPSIVNASLVSGLPAELMDPRTRDSDKNVHRFDVLAAVDRGFGDRGSVSGIMPRDPNGAVLAVADLHTDDRDGMTSADYLRFGLKVRSRYAGVFGKDESSVSASVPGSEFEPEELARWRRIVARYRGLEGDVKALKILTVLPLTKSLEKDPRTDALTIPDSSQPTPFVAVLDESWFREYGQGEELEARIVLVRREIGDDEDDERPFAAGTFPDRHAKPAGNPYYADKKSTDKKEDAAPMFTLPAFGPFGYSLDRSGNEALANATAFIIFPPRDIGPEWALHVQFRRVLRGLHPKAKEAPALEPMKGPWSDTHPLRTLADSAALCQSTGSKEKEDATLRIRANGGGKFAITPKGCKLDLRPFGPEVHPEVMKQYRYLLITGPTVSDGGRGVDIMLPEHAFWLDDASTARPLGNVTPVFAGQKIAGRVIEVITNGRYAAGAAPIDSAASLRKLFREHLLVLEEGETPVHDAHGAITRISQQIVVLPES